MNSQPAERNRGKFGAFGNCKSGISFKGFSLVEVTLAMGIISFTLLAVLALMPVGMNTIRQAIDSTQQAQILRRISGDVLLTPWSEISGLQGTNRYFDDEGQEQKSANASTCYRVQLSITNVFYPGSGNVSVDRLGSSLRQVNVTLISLNATEANRTNRFFLPIANSGN